MERGWGCHDFAAVARGQFRGGPEAAWIRAQAGDEAAYRESLAVLACRLRGFLRRRMQLLPDESEDLVQGTLLAIGLQRGTYESAVPVGRWALATSRATN